jgi:hypothetical protein
MAAIEYGSYYWCVVLNGKSGEGEECVHLHADDLKISENGALTFRSAGRRPAGAEPKRENKESQQESSQQNAQGNQGANNRKDDKDKESGEKSDMIYMAFAPGSWRLVYAAKLQDGTPASVEHWKSSSGRASLGATVPPDSGAAGYPTRA